MTLEGSVDALWKKYHAEEVVSQLTGVIAIKNYLAAVPTQDTSDELIAENVVKALARRTAIEPEAVQVQVANGVVTLTGVVPNWKAHDDAYRTALHTFGALEVDNQLLVALPSEVAVE